MPCRDIVAGGVAGEGHELDLGAGVAQSHGCLSEKQRAPGLAQIMGDEDQPLVPDRPQPTHRTAVTIDSG